MTDINEEADLEKVLNKARKLQEKAAGEGELGNEEYAKNIATALQNLLLKYKLSTADLVGGAEAEPIANHSINWDDHDFEKKNRRKGWLENLCRIVARAHGCQILVVPRSDRIVLVGKKSNVAIAEYVSVTLRRAAEKISWSEYDKFWRECDKNRCRERAKGYQGSWIEGFVGRIEERFKEAAKEQPEDNSRALVIIKTDLDEVNDFMSKQRYGRCTRVSRNISNSQGVSDGRSYAGGMDLRGNAVGGARRGGKKRLD